MPQDTRLLYLPRQRPRSFLIILSQSENRIERIEKSDLYRAFISSFIWLLSKLLVILRNYNFKIYTEMNFNGIQMSAVIKAANAMIAADGRIDEAETQLLSRELINFGVQPGQLPQLLELSQVMEPTTMLATLASMNDSQKKYVSGFLATIMVSDGDIDDAEMKLWQLTSTLMGCPTMSLQEALEYWANN